MMRSRRQNLPAALLGCLAFLLCLAGNASAAFDHSSQNIASGDFFWAADYASENPPEPLINSRERVHCGWKTASDALEGPNEYTFVRQNPWSKFDPLGLMEAETSAERAGRAYAKEKYLSQVNALNAAATARTCIDCHWNSDVMSMRLTPSSQPWFNKGRVEAEYKSGATMIGSTVGSFIPGVGELQDGQVLADPNAKGWEKSVAGGSLTLNAWLGGFAPNAGGIIRAGKEMTGNAVDAGTTVYKTAKTTSQNSAELAKNLAKEGRTVSKGEAAAHIVPSTGSKGHWAAGAESRSLLERLGININDAANGIPLGHPRPHNTTHTAAFHQSTNARLNAVVSSTEQAGRGNKATKKAVKKELRKIGKEVKK